MDRKLSDRITGALRNHYGSTTADLTYNNLYQLTIAVVLSAQTTDKQVNSVTPELFSKYPDFQSLARASQGDVEIVIKSTGFYRNKSKNIIALSKSVTEVYKGRLPDTREGLTQLPGIGRKSANVILSLGYNKPALAVDTHVLRISNRLGYVKTEDPLKAELALTACIPEDLWKEIHLIFIRHGREICSARNPQCDKCPVNHLCRSAGNIH